MLSSIVSCSSDGLLFVLVEEVGAGTALSQIIPLVQDAQLCKAPIQSYADKISGLFVPFVLCTSVLTFCVWISLTTTGTIPEDWYPEGFTPFVMTLSFTISVLVSDGGFTHTRTHAHAHIHTGNMTVSLRIDGTNGHLCIVWPAQVSLPSVVSLPPHWGHCVSMD